MPTLVEQFPQTQLIIWDLAFFMNDKFSGWETYFTHAVTNNQNDSNVFCRIGCSMFMSQDENEKEAKAVGENLNS